jgi:hypothetical protein
MYTTWDSYYFYAGFQVNDRNVISTNTTPVSQPQQDDDVELFFETDNASADHRTPHTYQMAVSAANGAYFSVGDDTSIPKARVVFTYKYAAKVDGTLNDPSSPDMGYTIEVAIPWQELGLQGPPPAGTRWGFNVISRDRDSTAVPADKLYSLSDKVKSNADVQNPSKWAKILFDAGGSRVANSASLVVSPEVTERFPLINGSIVSGEWPSISRLSFGDKAYDVPAPTTAEEPNTTESPFAAAETQPEQPTTPANPQPATPVTPPTVATGPQSGAPTSIPLPGGGSIRIVPGGIKNPVGLSNPVQASAGGNQNPLSPKYPTGYEPAPAGVTMTGTLTLGAPVKPNLVMAIYRVDFNGDPRKAGGQNIWDAQGKSLLIDQPMEGAGPWFSGQRMTWNRQQLWDMRRAGVNVALIRPIDGDKQLVHEVDAVVAALKDLKASGEDYPLIGVDAAGNSEAHIAMILDRIPDEFRAKWPMGDDGTLGALVYDAASAPDRLADGTTVAVVHSSDAAVVTGGGLDGNGKLVGRDSGQTYSSSWSNAISAKAPTVVLDSWNDYARGTELGESRQYGEKYVDQTRINTIQYNGDHQWRAKYLAYSVPRTFRPKTIYTVSLRIENAGTLPWRAGEGYALCPRWYRDGRLFDDSAPRIPLAHDVYPGQSAIVNLGVVAMNGYGDDLDPGNYVLVFDMVQGADKWFSYASEAPLQIPVTVLAKDAAGDKRVATFLSSTTPVTVDAGSTAATTVNLRNDGTSPWTSANKLACKIIDETGGEPKVVLSGDGVAFPDNQVQPGDIEAVAAKISTQGLAPGQYRLHWYVSGPEDAAVSGSYDEGIEVIPSAIRPSFVLSDIPRSVTAGKDFTSRLAVRNAGGSGWAKNEVQVGYHWYYLDGAEAAWDGGADTPIGQPVAAGQVDPDIVAKAHAPELPGRYILVWDAKTSGGWASTGSEIVAQDILPVIVTVTGKSDVLPVDLTKYVPASDPPFGADGSQLPVGMLPPDGAGEVDVNPLLLAKPGPPLYPSGYYAGTVGSGWSSNHAVPFLFSGQVAQNGIACTGQRIDLPTSAREVHVLAAASSNDPVSAAFGLADGSRITNSDITVASWKSAPSQPAWWSPYSMTASGDVDATPCYLGDYTLRSAGSHADGLVLPNAPSIKVLAVTVIH